MSPSDPIPQDLIETARAHGPEIVRLVADAFDRGLAQGESVGAVRMQTRAAEACEQHGTALREEFVRLDPSSIEELEGKFGAMSPSPIVAAFYEAGARSAKACAERVREVTPTVDSGEAH